MDKIYYNEKQKYGNGFYILVAMPIVAAFLFWALNMPQSSAPTEATGSYLSLLELIWIDSFMFVMSLVLFLLFRSMSLKITISGDYLAYSYPPFMRTPIKVNKGEIENWEVRTFSPIAEFGGFGYKKRKGLKTNDISYTKKGSKGLQLVLLEGTNVLIGTEHGARLQSAMRKWKEVRNG